MLCDKKGAEKYMQTHEINNDKYGFDNFVKTLDKLFNENYSFIC